MINILDTYAVQCELMTEDPLLARFLRNILNYTGNPVLTRLLKLTPVVYPHLNDFTGKQNFSCKI